MSRTESQAGCWTCRVRRKKCDRTWPVCHICSELLVTCHYALERPDWVDGGIKQREMTERLKQEIRQNAPSRRSLAYAKAAKLTADKPLPNFEMLVSEVDSRPTDMPRDLLHHLSLSQRQPVTISDNSNQTPSAVIPEGENLGHNTSAVDYQSYDRGSIACFLDFYFPFLFPFYQPSILDRGRAWVMDLILDNQLMHQTILSVSSYFLSRLLETTKSERCMLHSWGKLLDQIHGTFSLLQQELLQPAGGDAAALLRTIPIMGCILMLQRFETTVQSFENCQPHLDAATELFEKFLAAEHLPQVQGQSQRLFIQQIWISKFSSDSLLWKHGRFQTMHAPSSELMAFRFFSALLLVDDIVASTALGEEPKLYKYHETIIGDGQWGPESDDKIPLRLDGILGCQNWVMVAVAQISVLNAWKQQQKQAGDFDMVELVRRAEGIKDTITANLAYNETTLSLSASINKSSVLDSFLPWRNQEPSPVMSSVLVTRIWAHAASIYLSVVISGWQPLSTPVRHNVTRVLELLTTHKLPPAVLRTVAWPFCVAGCLADPAEESCFRRIVEALQPPSIHGLLWKALEVMESVWCNRGSRDCNKWDLAACFRQSGYLVLLV